MKDIRKYNSYIVKVFRETDTKTLKNMEYSRSIADKIKTNERIY